MSITAPVLAEDELVPQRELSEVASRSHATIFVWGFWAVLFPEAVYYLYRYGTGIPLDEEWYALDFLTGKLKPTLSVLWSQGSGIVSWSGHRTPLPTLLIYYDVKSFGVNFWPILSLHLAICGVLAAGLIWAVGHVRGRLEYADAFFPLLLLHIGHYEIWLWSGTLPYVLTTFFAGCFLIIQVVTRWRPGPISALASGMCLLLLPLCYGGGAAFTPFLALSLGYSGYRLNQSRERSERTAGGLCLFFSLAAVLVFAAYMYGYKEPKVDTSVELQPTATAWVVVKSTMKFLAMGFGPAARPQAFPASGLVVSALLLVAFGCLLSSLRRQSPAGRDRAVGLSCFLMGCLGVSLAAGYSRATWEPMYLFSSRYAISSLPTLLCLYFIWEFCGPQTWKTFGRMVLFSLALSALSQNWAIAMYEGPKRSDVRRDFERDVRAGVSIPEIISRHAFGVCFATAQFENGLKFLRDKQMGDFRNLPPDPRFREVRLDLAPVDSYNVQWTGKAGRGTGDKPYLTFELKEPTYVLGIRIKYSSKNAAGRHPWFQMSWRDTRKNQEFVERAAPGVEPRCFMYWASPSGEEKELTVWICRTLDQIRVSPDKQPCEFTISEMTLLLPDSQPE